MLENARALKKVSACVPFSLIAHQICKTTKQLEMGRESPVTAHKAAISIITMMSSYFHKIGVVRMLPFRVFPPVLSFTLAGEHRPGGDCCAISIPSDGP